MAKTTLKRLPSSVYWQGLSVWGIRSFSGAQVQYHRSLDRYYAQVTRHGGRASERDVEHDDLIPPNWHAGLFRPPEDFPKECSLEPDAQRSRISCRAHPLEPGLLRLAACGIVAHGDGMTMCRSRGSTPTAPNCRRNCGKCSITRRTSRRSCTARPCSTT